MGSLLKDFFIKGRQKQFSAGELILSGDISSGVYYIEAGFVSVYSISDTGEKYLHIIYRNREIFPLIWALKDRRRRVYYEAIAKTTVRVVEKDSFLALIDLDLQAAHEILNQLADQFNVYADRLDNLQYKQARERIIYRILFLAARFGERKGKTIVIEVPITHELIAESINLTRETVSRELELLEKQGLIARQNKRIAIHDLEALAKQFSEPISLDLWGLTKQ